MDRIIREENNGEQAKPWHLPTGRRRRPEEEPTEETSERQVTLPGPMRVLAAMQRPVGNRAPKSRKQEPLLGSNVPSALQTRDLKSIVGLIDWGIPRDLDKV